MLPCMQVNNITRKIAVITGTRAEYGLLHGLLDEIKFDPELTLQLIVSGMHLSHEFGLTYREIEKDGFQVDYKVEMLLSSDTAVGVAKSVGLGVLGFADCFAKLKPDLIVILGDRFEILAAAQTAMIMKIPIAHIHGGELSQGAIDDGIRHAITKMSHLHFTAANAYRDRVIQLGENPDVVYNVGALGVQRIKNMKLLSQSALEKVIGFQFAQPTFLVAYHPATLQLEKTSDELSQLFSALDLFEQAKIIITKANADEAGRLINHQIDLYAAKQPKRVKAFTSMGDLNYLSAMRCVDVVIGNSSSGIIEAPSFKKPTVNIGIRQDGRLRAGSVIDCGASISEIHSAIQAALSDGFKHIVAEAISPYDSGKTAASIKNIIKTVDLTTIIKKKFFDLKVHGNEQFKNHHYC